MQLPEQEMDIYLSQHSSSILFRFKHLESRFIIGT